jgi:acyl carrier protein
MNMGGIRGVVLQELHRIAPDVDIDSLPPDRDVREELDLDSMDFLRFVTGLHDALGVSVPESDYRRITTVRGCTEYLASKLGPGAE